MSYIAFSQEEKRRARETDLVDYLRTRGETLRRSGREYRWVYRDATGEHDSITVYGNKWFDHKRQCGGDTVSFVRRYLNMSYQEAVLHLLGGQAEQQFIRITPADSIQERLEKYKNFSLPPAHDTMRRVFAYLMKSRFINGKVVSFFAHEKMIYEDIRHNAVFVGYDNQGLAKHASIKGTLSDRQFRGIVDGSHPAYTFRHMGGGRQLFVFEAAIDMLAYITLYPDQWQQQNYVALDGTSEHALLQCLKNHPQIDTVLLSLDHDPGGMEAAGRLKDIVTHNGFQGVIKSNLPKFKDWDEVLKARHGIPPLPAVPHPRIQAYNYCLNNLVSFSCGDSDIARERIHMYTKQGNYLRAAGAALSYAAESKAEQSHSSLDDCENQLKKSLCGAYLPHTDRKHLQAKIGRVKDCFASLIKGWDNVSTDQRHKLLLAFVDAAIRVEVEKSLLQINQIKLEAESDEQLSLGMNV